jgi:site-specific DNA recombinase
MSIFGQASLAGRVAVYARVSTDDQCKDPENSLDNQLHRCRAYLQAQAASPDVLSTVRSYREEGKSGKDINRPELQRLLKDMRQGLVKVVLFADLSRISRSVPDFLKLTEFFKDQGVTWIMLSPSIDMTSPYGHFMLILLVALAELERKTTAQRTRNAMRDRAERGLFNGGSVPFGYAKNPVNKTTLCVVEDDAQAVRDAFAAYLECGSITKTEERLASLGYRRKERTTESGRELPAAPLSFNVINHMLRNPTYVALKEVNPTARDLPPEEVLALDEASRYRLVPAAWPPIIDMDTFERAQALLQENRIRTANSLAPRSHEYVLTGIVHCAACGRGLEGAAAKRQQYHYYQHATGTLGPDCGPRGHRVELIEAAVLERLAVLADDEDLLDQVVQKANDRIDDGVPERMKSAEAAQRRVEKLEADQTQMTRHLLAMSPEDVPAFFWKAAKGLEQDLVNAKGEAARLAVEVNEMKAARLNPADYRAALRRFGQVYNNLDPVQKGDLLAYLLDRVEVRAVMEDGKLVATEVTIALLDEKPDVARYEKGADGKYRQPPFWLRCTDLNRGPGD